MTTNPLHAQQTTAAPATAENIAASQRMLAFSGASLMVASLLVGILAAGAMSGTLPVDGRMLLGAHLTGLMGVFFLFALAWSLPMVRYGQVGQSRLVWAVMTANWANLIIGTAKAPFGVHGVGYTEGAANNLVFVLLNVFVVVPTIAAAAAWAFGLRAPKR